jgi:antitoxin YefM
MVGKGRAISLDDRGHNLYCVPVQKKGERKDMPIQTTYTQARANLSSLFKEVTENREIVIIRRRSGEDVALVAADELASLTETAHLLRSPRNARRLLLALARAQSRTKKPQTLEALKKGIGLGEKG